MRYETIYDYIPGSSKIYSLIPLFIITIISIVLIILLKKYYKNYSFVRQVLFFIVYLFCGISSLMTIISIFKIPKIIFEEKQLKEIIKRNN